MISMPKRYWLLLAGAGLSAAVVLGQTLPPTVRIPQRGGFVSAPSSSAWGFAIQGTNYSAVLERAQAVSAPDWTPSESLPLSPGKTEAIARKELRKLVGDDSGWTVAEFTLRPFESQDQDKWIWTVRLRSPATNSIRDQFTLPVSFSGEPARITKR